MCSARYAEDKTGSDKLNWEQTLSLLQQIRVSCTSKQKGIAHHAQQQQLCPISYIKRVAQTGRETTKTSRRVSKRRGTTSLTWANRQNLITLLDLCVSPKHPPNTVKRLSHNSTGHGVVGVNTVVTRCSSQHSASKNGGREMRRCPRSCEHHPPTIRSLHRRAPAVSQLRPISDSNNSD